MPASAAGIRRTNAFDVIRAIHALPEPTRRVIAAESGLSVATVSSIVADFIARDVVHETGTQRQATGRPTAHLALNCDHGLLIGVDIAETYVHVESFDFALRKLSSTELPLDARQNEPRAVTDRVSEAIRCELRRDESGPAPVLGVGVSVPGQVDPAGGASVFAPNWGWHNVPLLALLQDSIDAPLVLENPLKASTIAELWSGAGRSVKDFVVLTIGTGVGAGIALDGKVYRGPTNSAGEWGHTVLVAEGRSCRCGSSGCIEAYVGAPGIAQTLQEIAPTSPMLIPGDQTATLQAIRAGLDDDDPVATLVIERTGMFLGIGIANLINILNPELIVLGGWVVGILGDKLLDAARPQIRNHALPTAVMATRVDIQEVDGNPVSLGAAARALESYLDSVHAIPRNQWAPVPSLSDAVL